jgi:hypothetical protein
MAKFLIEDLHPISKTRLDTAFPLICCPLRVFRNNCGGCFKEEEDPSDINKKLLENFAGRALTKEQIKLRKLQ